MRRDGPPWSSLRSRSPGPLFDASVDAQLGAYATGVLVLMISAAVAVTLASRRDRESWLGLLAITVVFVYTTITNVIERPEGMKIASVFIVTIIVVSMLSRTFRATELRVQGVWTDPRADRFLNDAAAGGNIRIIANRPDSGTRDEYEGKLREARETHNLDPRERVLFLEVRLNDASTHDAHDQSRSREKAFRVPDAPQRKRLHIIGITTHQRHDHHAGLEAGEAERQLGKEQRCQDEHAQWGSLPRPRSHAPVGQQRGPLPQMHDPAGQHHGIQDQVNRDDSHGEADRFPEPPQEDGTQCRQQRKRHPQPVIQGARHQRVLDDMRRRIGSR